MFQIHSGFLDIFMKRISSNLKNAKQRKKPAKSIAGATTKLNPELIPKFSNQLMKPPAYQPFVIKDNKIRKGKMHRKKRHFYFIDVSEFKQQILPNGFPKTTVWGYGGLLQSPVELDTLLLAPAERADILIDFSNI